MCDGIEQVLITRDLMRRPPSTNLTIQESAHLLMRSSINELENSHLDGHQMSTLLYNDAAYVAGRNALLWSVYAALGMLEYFGPHCTPEHFPK